MKKTIYIILLLAYILTLITGCDFMGLSAVDTDGVPREVKELYTLFMETQKYDISESVQYCYFRNEELRQRQLERKGEAGVGEDIILEWVQLSDELWAINVRTEYEKTYFERYHFVGYIDGKPYVMTDQYEIPRELKDGLDLTPYMRDAVLLPLEDE